jgi:thiosulfate/3-mercaptopyruvate sulfurtransferase
MTGDQLAALLADNAVNLVDVRTPTEYEGTAGHHCDPVQGHIPGAVNIELEALLHADRRKELDALLEERGIDREKPIVVYCHSGSRSGIAATALTSAGIEAVNYHGSWHEWSRRAG